MADNKVLALYLGSTSSPEFPVVDITSKNFDSVNFFTTENAEIISELTNDGSDETKFLLLK